MPGEEGWPLPQDAGCEASLISIVAVFRPHLQPNLNALRFSKATNLVRTAAGTCKAKVLWQSFWQQEIGETEAFFGALPLQSSNS